MSYDAGMAGLFTMPAMIYYDGLFTAARAIYMTRVINDAGYNLQRRIRRMMAVRMRRVIYGRRVIRKYGKFSTG
jgi:hypothetical protein